MVMHTRFPFSTVHVTLNSAFPMADVNHAVRPIWALIFARFRVGQMVMHTRFPSRRGCKPI
jgi:hypothetical protein